VRAVGGGARERAADGGGAGPTDAPVPHPGDERRELSAQGRQAPPEQPPHVRGPDARTDGGRVRPAAGPSRYKEHTSGAAFLDRLPLHYSSVVHRPQMHVLPQSGPTTKLLDSSDNPTGRVP